MNNSTILDTLKKVCTVIARILGPTTETLIHDLSNGEIIFIENGNITGRTVGDKSNKTTLDTFFKNVGEDGILVNYTSNSKFQKELRSSNILIKDDEGNDIYAICINQDISALNEVKNFLDYFTRTESIESQEAKTSKNIQDITQKIILDEMLKVRPLSLDSKDAKISIIQRLDEKGVFDVKDAVPKVCELLSISQATLYNYQREIRVSRK